MRIVNQIGTYTQEDDPNPGLIEVLNKIPPGLECPDFEQGKLDEDVFMIETEDADPNLWGGCYVFWRGSRWKIEESLSIQNGERALILATVQEDETKQRIPTQGKEETKEELPRG